MRATFKARDSHVVFVEAAGLRRDTVREDPKIVAQALGDHVEMPPSVLELPGNQLELHVDSLELLVDLLEPSVDLLEPFVDSLEPSVDLLEPPVDLLEPPVDLLEPFVDLLEPFVDLLEPFVDSLEPPVDLLESLVGLSSRAGELGLHRRKAPIHPFFELRDGHRFVRGAHHSIVVTAMTMPMDDVA